MASHARRCILATSLIAVSTAVAQSPAPTAVRPDYTGLTQSIQIPFSNDVNFTQLKSLRVRASINGGPDGEFVVDTGSVGMIVTAYDVPGVDPKGPPGEITYSSSGVHLEGVWTQARVTFSGARGGKATAIVPVLAVFKETCTGSGVNASNCKPNDHPHTHMMGIGFGRGAEGGQPWKNPFLNLEAMQAGSMRRGYLITRDGFMLGLTAQNTQPGFVWQKLTERPVLSNPYAAPDGSKATKLKDWETAPGSFSIRGAHAGPGTVLIDTGLTNMMLATPEATPKTDLKDGTAVTIDLLDGQLHYAFTTGDVSDPQAPRRASWVKPTHGVYVNTGLRALAHFDYLYDADAGFLALRPTKP